MALQGLVGWIGKSEVELTSMLHSCIAEYLCANDRGTVLTFVFAVLFRRVQELCHTLQSTFAHTLFTHLYPHSTIALTLQILSQDGSLLATCLNAATLALIDAGIPMSDYIAACTVGSTAGLVDREEDSDPVLDVNGLEENELPFLTVGSTGDDGIHCLVMESRCQVGRLEAMISVGLDGCRQIRGILDGCVKSHGRKVLEGKVS